MTTPEFTIGELIPFTETVGKCIVKDIFRSVTNQDWFCYRVETEDKTSYLMNEEDLLS